MICKSEVMFGKKGNVSSKSIIILHYETCTTSVFVVCKSDGMLGKNGNVSSKSVISDSSQMACILESGLNIVHPIPGISPISQI